jgi:hypothetical protein
MWFIAWLVPTLANSPLTDQPCPIGNSVFREKPSALEPFVGPVGTRAFLSRDEVSVSMNLGTGTYLSSAVVHVLLSSEEGCPVTVATVMLPGSKITHVDPVACSDLTPEELVRQGLSWTRGATGTFTVTARGFRSGSTEWRWFGRTFAAVPASPDARLSVVASDDSGWLEVRNDGPTPVDLTGITLRDTTSGVQAALLRPAGASVLAPGATIRVGQEGDTEAGGAPVGAIVDFGPWSLPSSFDLLAGERVVASRRP